MANEMSLYDVTSHKSTKTMQQQVRDFIEPEARITNLRRAILIQMREVLRQVVDLRQKRVTQFGRRLWDRYKRDIKFRKIDMSFVDWLIERHFLENTFASTGNRGFSLKQRLRWVKFWVERVRHRSVAPEDDPTDTSWFTDDATLDLNKRQHNTEKAVKVTIIDSPTQEGEETFEFTELLAE